MGIQIRNYRPGDLELIVVMLNAAESVDHADLGTSVHEMREQLNRPGVSPEQDGFVAEDESGRIVAFGYLEFKQETEECGYRCWFNIHPMFRGRGLEDRMLARLEERASELMVEVSADKVYLSASGHAAYAERLAAFERARMKEIRRFWVMLREHLETLPAPQFPEGLVIRGYRMGEDDAESLDALNDSFSEHFGHCEEYMEDWQNYLHSSAYRPDLTVVAIDPQRNRIAGFNHISVNEGECRRLGHGRGWIDILGVRKEYRKRGLGEALILQGMHNLRQAGMSEAVLGCDSQNTTNATKLYFRVGFRVLHETIAHGKYLRQPEQQAEPEREPALS